MRRVELIEHQTRRLCPLVMAGEAISGPNSARCFRNRAGRSGLTPGSSGEGKQYSATSQQAFHGSSRRSVPTKRRPAQIWYSELCPTGRKTDHGLLPDRPALKRGLAVRITGCENEDTAGGNGVTERALCDTVEGHSRSEERRVGK